MSTLDQWEAEAKNYCGPDDWVYAKPRILALIELIRKKDEKLARLLPQADRVSGGLGAGMSMLIHKTLALTENLK